LVVRLVGRNEMSNEWNKQCNVMIHYSTMMTCHLSIRPAATCTVPHTQLLAASRRHVAASYWIAASDVAPTSARSSPSWLTTVAGGEPPLTAARPPLTTTGPPLNGGWWAGQRLEMGRSGSALGRVWIGSGPGPDQVWAGSAMWHATCQPRVHTCAHVASTWMLTWIMCHMWESNLDTAATSCNMLRSTTKTLSRGLLKASLSEPMIGSDPEPIIIPRVLWVASTGAATIAVVEATGQRGQRRSTVANQRSTTVRHCRTTTGPLPVIDGQPSVNALGPLYTQLSSC
nr:hypothetical protein [Tanacetum cinerariifolium]